MKEEGGQRKDAGGKRPSSAVPAHKKLQGKNAGEIGTRSGQSPRNNPCHGSSDSPLHMRQSHDDMR